MKKKSPEQSTFKDSDFVGVDPANRQALVTALNTLSEQVQQTGQALQDMTADEPQAPIPESQASQPSSDPVEPGRPAVAP